MFYKGLVFDSGNLNANNINDELNISTLIAMICLASSFLSRAFKNKINLKIIGIKEKSFCEIFYLNNRAPILFFFVIIICIVGFLNNQFNIYQRGFIVLIDFPMLLQNLFKWLIVFGFTTFSCFILYIEILNFKKLNFFTIIVSIFEIFISYTSMLSRSFIINSISLTFPLYQKTLNLKKNYDNFFYIIFIVLIFLTSVSIYSVNYLRIDLLRHIDQNWKLLLNPLPNGVTHYIENNSNNSNAQNINNSIPQSKLDSNDKIKKSSFQIPNKLSPEELFSNDITIFILVNRWIGIDSLILVHNSKKKNFDLFFKSLKESKNAGSKNTFYEETFGLSAEKINYATNKESLKGNTLPGIVTFLYYSGSLIFVSISLFVIIFLFNFFEIFVKKITRGNIIFACFLSNMIATRLIHFGYAPKDSYLFIISILLSLALMFFLLKFNFYFLSKK